MKITKKALKQLIKEELSDMRTRSPRNPHDEFLSPEGRPDPKSDAAEDVLRQLCGTNAVASLQRALWNLQEFDRALREAKSGLGGAMQDPGWKWLEETYETETIARTIKNMSNLWDTVHKYGPPGCLDVASKMTIGRKGSLGLPEED